MIRQLVHVQQLKTEQEHLQCERSLRDTEEGQVCSSSPSGSESAAGLHHQSVVFLSGNGACWLCTHPSLQTHSLLRVDAGVLAASFSLKVVCVALTTSVPELSAGVGLGVVVPPDYVLPTGTGVQRLTAPPIWKDKKGAINELFSLDE